MMRICVAGADCFIGIPLIKALANKVDEVVAVVKEDDASRSLFNEFDNVTTISLDFHNYEALGDTIGYVDCLIVLTWIGTRGETRQNEKLQKENYNIISSAIKSVIAKGCKKVLTAGSQAEYGLVDGIISEDTPCNPNTEYGKYKLKLFNDMSVYCAQNGVSYKEPRFFSLYGPGDFSGTLIMSTIDKMLKNEDCPFTESTQSWDYLYIEDAVDAISQLCFKKCPEGAYNIGNGDSKPLKDFIEELKRIINSNSKLNFGAVPYGKSGAVSIHPNISKIKREIGWEPKFSFEQGIRLILKQI